MKIRDVGNGYYRIGEIVYKNGVPKYKREKGVWYRCSKNGSVTMNLDLNCYPCTVTIVVDDEPGLTVNDLKEGDTIRIEDDVIKYYRVGSIILFQRIQGEWRQIKGNVCLRSPAPHMACQKFDISRMEDY